MYNGYNSFGMDQMTPIMGDNHELFDYSSEGFLNNNNYKTSSDDDKFLCNNNESNKEKFESDNSIENNNSPIVNSGSVQPVQSLVIPSTNELIKSIYSKFSSNINYMFIIVVLIIICIAQKNTIDQMKFLLMMSMNKNTDFIKPPIPSS